MYFTFEISPRFCFSSPFSTPCWQVRAMYKEFRDRLEAEARDRASRRKEWNDQKEKEAAVCNPSLFFFQDVGAAAKFRARLFFLCLFFSHAPGRHEL